MTPEFDEYGVQIKRPRKNDIDEYGIPFKKKAESIGFSNPSVPSWLSSTGPLPSQGNVDFTGKENAEGFRNAIKNKVILPEMVTDADIKKQAQSHVDEAASKISGTSKDPLKDILYSELPDYGKEHPEVGARVFGEKLKLLNNAFTTGDQAKQYLNSQGTYNVSGKPIEQLKTEAGDNVTKRAAVNRVESQRNVEDAFVHGARTLEDAAMYYAANSGDENMKYLLDKGGGPMAVPPALRGEKILQFIMNPDVRELADKNPKLKTELNETIANFPVNHREYAAKLLADYIAKKREEKGLNSAWVNVVGKESTDKIMDEAIKNGDFPANYKFVYEKEIRPKLGTWQSVGRGIGNAIPIVNKAVNEAPIPTPGLLENIETGAENTETSISKSIASLLGADPRSQLDKTQTELEKEHGQPEFEPSSSLHKLTMHGGQMVPFVASLVGGGELLQGANLIKSPELASATMMALATHGDNQDRALTLFPGNRTKQTVYTAVMDGLNASMAKFLPGQKIPQLLKGDNTVIADAIKQMVDGKITTDASKSKILNVFGNAAKGVLGGAEFSGAIAGADDLLSQTLQGKGIDFSQTTEKTWHGLKAGAIASVILVGGEAALKSNKGVQQTIYEMASNPEAYKEIINNDPQYEPIRKQVLDNIDYLSKVKTEADNIPSLKKESDKQKYIVDSFNEKKLTEKAENTTDPTIKKKIQQEAKDLHEVKEGALNGIPAEKIKENQAIKEVKGMYSDGYLTKDANELLESKKTEESEPKFDESKVKLFLQHVSENQQKKYPDRIVDLANDMFPEAKKEETKSSVAITEPRKTGAETTKEGVSVVRPEPERKSTSVITPEENKVPENIPLKKQNETQQQSPEATEQKLSEEKGGAIEQPIENKQAAETGKGEPPKEPAGNDLPFGKQETVGVSHEAQQVRAYDVNASQPIRGEGVDVAESIEHGKKLIADGVDPQKIADDFKNDPDKKISYNGISTTRAHYNSLAKTTDIAEENFGRDSNEYKEAKAKERDFYNDSFKPMTTEWHKIGQGIQGLTDIDTGTFTGLSRAVRERTGKDLTEDQAKKAKELSGKVKTLEKEVETLKKKLTDVIDKNSESTPKKGTKQSAKDLADKIRENAKLHKPGSFSAATPASLVWDTAVEIVAKTIEAGGTIIHAVQRGIENIRESDWYKSLSDTDKKKAEEDFSDFHISQQDTDILTRLAYKKDSKFTTDEVKAIWEYAKENYLDKGASFDEMISKTASDLGMKTTQIRDALITPKGAKTITDAMYKKQNDRNMAIQQAKDWAAASKVSPLVRFLKSIPRFFFAAKVFGHGTVGMITHAGANIYDPVEWKRYWPTFFKQFKFAYGKQANYEKAMQDLRNDPQFLFWKRNGLAVDPTERYDDYQYITNMFNRMGRVGRWLTAGDRGFNALKVYRLERAKALWNNLSDIEKADPNTPKDIAKLVNHSSGTTNLKVSEAAQVAFFAPNLELSRWNKLIVDPAKAVKAFTNWNNATPAEKAAAKIVAKRAGRILSTYVGALAVNQGLLSLSGSNQQVNLFNPTQSDWLKFKAGGRTIDATGGMVSLIGFLTRLGNAAFSSSKDLKGKSRKDEVMNQTFNYASGKLSPFASTVKDLTTHHDFQGNTLPFYNDKPLHSWNTKLTLKEYLEKQQTPIPVAEYFTDLDKQMQDEGIPKAKALNIIQSIFIAGMVGGTGVHIGEEPTQRPSPFTEEDKKDSVFIRVIEDWKMELPNTSAASEIITEEENGTKKKLSEYPQKTIDNYLKVHKDYLKESLQSIFDNGTVYVKKYKDAQGNPKNEVSLNVPTGEYEEVDLKNLSQQEKAQVLSLAQKSATTKTQKELFNSE